jgi:thioredoxin reductase (NADPH)
MVRALKPGEAELTETDLAVLARVGDTHSVEVGDVLYRPGDDAYDFIVIIDARVDVIGGVFGGDEVLIVSHGPRDFLGELNMLTDARSVLTARVAEAGQVITIPRPELHRLLGAEPDLADRIVAAFIARRRLLRDGDGSASLQILGSRFSARTQALRAFLNRSGQPHRFVDLDVDADAHVLLDRLGVQPSETPVVLTVGGLMRNPTPGQLAECLGLAYHPIPGRIFDLVVVGAGPAGLAATVYGASEGLETLTLEGIVVGGQAGSSSRIENYLGFPQGVSGQDLTDRASVQAQRFGAHIASPCAVSALRHEPGFHVLTLVDGSEVPARAVIVASGAEYRRPDIARWQEMEGAGVYYAATEMEANLCAGSPVVVLGGGNSAGQASIFLASKGCDVHILIRGEDLLSSMSRYLVDRVEAEPRISVITGATITALHGTERLTGITATMAGDEADRHLDVDALFCFIGAVPSSAWLGGGVLLDDNGFIRTDRDLSPDDLGTKWTILDRIPLPFESSVPGVFAAGDVRAGSVKRVAAAVGEGSAAVRSVHQYLALAG